MSTALKPSTQRQFSAISDLPSGPNHYPCQEAAKETKIRRVPNSINVIHLNMETNLATFGCLENKFTTN